jgi:hypothetical protein
MKPSFGEVGGIGCFIGKMNWLWLVIDDTQSYDVFSSKFISF